MILLTKIALIADSFELKRTCTNSVLHCVLEHLCKGNPIQILLLIKILFTECNKSLCQQNARARVCVCEREREILKEISVDSKIIHLHF